MKLTPEQQMELAFFPALLRALIELELAAGNSVVEVGHSFPAPPAGAYFKLANKVTTRPRDSSGGLDFHERNNSSYSGVFTDAKRFYFLLEPPNPPPAEPDMDAIRKELEVRPAVPQLSIKERISTAGVHTCADQPPHNKAQPTPASAKPDGLAYRETATGVTHILHFQDKRPPQEIQFALERDLMVLFTPTMENGILTISGKPKVNGSEFHITLHFDATVAGRNCYSLHVETSWNGQPVAKHDYYRKSAHGWFDFWTRNFQGAIPPHDVGSTDRYQALCEAAMRAEAHLDTVPALQHDIVEWMKQGAYFRTSDKEGDTTISWSAGRFVRVRSGDDPGEEIFANESNFLTSLRQFYDWETSKHIYPNKVSELEAWKLIRRQLRTK